MRFFSRLFFPVAFAVLFLSPGVLSSKALALDDGLDELLQLDFAGPNKDLFFVEIGGMVSRGFGKSKGVHEELGYGGFIEASVPIVKVGILSLRPALEIAGLYSDRRGDIENLDLEVLDFSAMGIFYVDLKVWRRFAPYLGIGGGYHYVREEREGSDNRSKIDDEAGAAILAGYAGAVWQIQKGGSWFVNLGYAYVYGLEDHFLTTRGVDQKGRISPTHHRVRLGIRVGF